MPGIYVGKDASADGMTIIARSEDQRGGSYNKMFKVQKRVTKAGRYLTDEGTEFKIKLPKTTYKYTYVPDSSDANDGQYFASCTNEYGVVVVETVFLVQFGVFVIDFFHDFIASAGDV